MRVTAFKGQLGTTLGSILLLASIMTGFPGCETLVKPPEQELETAYGPTIPKIEEVFSNDEVGPRSDRRIYLKGADPDGDLYYIYILAEVPWGDTHFRIKVDRDQGSLLSGYLEFSTWAFYEFSPLWIRMQLTLEDRAGHRSETIALTYSVSAMAHQTSPPPGIFQERFLGRIPLETLPKAVGPGI